MTIQNQETFEIQTFGDQISYGPVSKSLAIAVVTLRLDFIRMVTQVVTLLLTIKPII